MTDYRYEANLESNGNNINGNQPTDDRNEGDRLNNNRADDGQIGGSQTNDGPASDDPFDGEPDGGYQRIYGDPGNPFGECEDG